MNDNETKLCGAWYVAKNSSYAAKYAACAVVGNKVYSFGGLRTTMDVASENWFSNDVDIYDPETNTSTNGTAIPKKQYGSTAIAVGNDIYLVGGTVYAGSVNTVRIYRTETNSWTSGGSLPVTRANTGLALHDGKIYCLGGRNKTTTNTSLGQLVSTAFVYDINTRVWTQIEDMPVATDVFSSPCVNIGDDIYFGRNLYHIPSKEWSLLDNSIGNGPGHYHEGKVYSFSGRYVTIYDMENKTRHTEPGMPTPRSYIAFTACGKKCYCIHGVPASGLSRDREIYTIGEEEKTITNQYLSRHGTVLSTETTASVVTGDSYRVSYRTIGNCSYVGYRINGGELQYEESAYIPEIQGDYTITFVYDKILKINERCINTSNTLLGIPVVTHDIEEFGSFQGAAPMLDNYAYLGYNISNGEMQEGRNVKLENIDRNYNVNYVYTPATTFSIQEQYLDREGEAVQEDTRTVVVFTEDYVQTAPAIDGYRCVGHKIDDGALISSITASISDVQSNHTVAFIYEEDVNHLGITEQFLSAEGAPLQPEHFVPVDPGDDYEEIAPRISGWKRVGHRIDGGEPSPARTAQIFDIRQSHTVTFLYEPCDGEYCQDILITESYYDRVNGEYIQPDTYTYLAAGDDYEQTAPVISGYKRVGHSIDGGPEQSSLTALIPDVQEDHHVTFLYEPGEDDGGGEGPGDGGGEGPGDGGGEGPGDGGGEGPGDGGGEGPGDGGGEGPGDGGGEGPGDGGGEGPGDGGGEGPGDGGSEGPGDGGGGDGEDILITERYLDTTKQTYIQAGTTTKVARGATYQKTAPAISGYFRTGHRIDNGADQSAIIAVIPDVQESHVVTFLYEPAVDCDDFVIREQYWDVVNEQFIQPATETLVEPGGDYRKEAPEIEGYARIGHRIDGGGDQTSLTAEILNVRTDHVVTFFYQPEDGGGEGPGGGKCCCCCEKHLPTLDIHIPIVCCNKDLIREVTCALGKGCKPCCCSGCCASGCENQDENNEDECH